MGAVKEATEKESEQQASQPQGAHHGNKTTAHLTWQHITHKPEVDWEGEGEKNKTKQNKQSC